MKCNRKYGTLVPSQITVYWGEGENGYEYKKMSTSRFCRRNTSWQSPEKKRPLFSMNTAEMLIRIGNISSARRTVSSTTKKKRHPQGLLKERRFWVWS